jgi:hypothetical protein
MRHVRSSLLVLVVLTGMSGGRVFAQANVGTSKGNDPVPDISYSLCTPSTTVGPEIPCTFWGILVNQLGDYPLLVPYGEWRGWDAGVAQWPDIAPNPVADYQITDPNFVWGNLDTELSNVLSQAEVNNVLYTLSRTPTWASQDPADQTCNYAKQGFPNTYGECDPPVDLNSDGKGTNAKWRTWVAAIAYHVKNSSTDAHIKYWEPWNEFSRSTTIENTGNSFEGTYDQLVRMTEDLNCIVTGRVKIISATGEACSAVLDLFTPKLSGPIDPSAVIVMPSTAGANQDAAANFLYCDHTPKGPCDFPGKGAKAVDVINVHLYATNTKPEDFFTTTLPSFRTILQPAELAKPLWSGEGSWGNTLSTTNCPGGGDCWKDLYAQAGFIPRYFAMLLSADVAQLFWYGYDFDNGTTSSVGALYCPPDESCSPAGLIQPPANAWILTYNWLTNGVPASSPFCNISTQGSTIYECDFVKSNGYQARLVWDWNAVGSLPENCSSTSNPIVCGSTRYMVTEPYLYWVDLSGAVHSAASATILIGANPILLENQLR